MPIKARPHLELSDLKEVEKENLVSPKLSLLCDSSVGAVGYFST